LHFGAYIRPVQQCYTTSTSRWCRTGVDYTAALATEVFRRVTAGS
jgi:hypothetical protein